MTAVLPQTRCVEAAIHLRTCPAVRHFGGLLVGVFGGVVVPLLLVGEVFDYDEDDEEARDGGLNRVHGGMEAGVEE